MNVHTLSTVPTDEVTEIAAMRAELSRFLEGDRSPQSISSDRQQRLEHSSSRFFDMEEPMLHTSRSLRLLKLALDDYHDAAGEGDTFDVLDHAINAAIESGGALRAAFYGRED